MSKLIGASVIWAVDFDAQSARSWQSMLDADKDAVGEIHRYSDRADSRDPWVTETLWRPRVTLILPSAVAWSQARPLRSGEIRCAPMRSSDAEHIVWLNPDSLDPAMAIVEADSRWNPLALSGLNDIVCARAAFDAVMSGADGSDLSAEANQLDQLTKQVIETRRNAAQPFTSNSTQGTRVNSLVLPRVLPEESTRDAFQLLALRTLVANQQLATEAAEAERRRADEEKRRERTIKGLAQIASAAIGGVALVGLFAALAAIPRDGSAFTPYVRAAFLTILVATVIAVVVGGLDRLVRSEPRSPTLTRNTGWAALGLGACLAAFGWLSESPSYWLLGLVCLLAIGGLALVVLSVDSGQHGSPDDNEPG